MGAQLAWGDPHGFYHVVQAVEEKSGEIQFLADLFYHFFIIRAVWIRVVVQQLVGNFVAFPFPDDPSGDQIHDGSGTGEV